MPCFVKQLGKHVIDTRADGTIHSQIDESECWPTPVETIFHKSGRMTISLKDRKGGDPEEWPEDLRVQQFPGEVHVVNR